METEKVYVNFMGSNIFLQFKFEVIVFFSYINIL